jgi:hypothetical protein
VAVRILLTLALLGLMVFCGFGLLASFEPLPAATQWPWRILYGATLVASLVGLGCLWNPSAR